MPLFGLPDIEKMKEKKDIKGLYNAGKGKDPDIVIKACIALSELGLYAPKGLLWGIESNDWQIRIKAYVGLFGGNYGGYIAMIASLHDPNEKIRMLGLQILSHKKELRAIQSIGDCILYDPSSTVREAAVYSLFYICGDQGLNYFLTARKDPDVAVRKSADEVLNKLGY